MRHVNLVLAALMLIGLAFIYLCAWLWYNDAATVPTPRDRAAIMAIECDHWKPNGYKEHFGVIIVERGSYAAVTTFVDMKNLALYHRATNVWTRMTPNGWLFEYDKLAFWKAGAPLLISNALVNGLRREYHKWNPDMGRMPRCQK